MSHRLKLNALHFANSLEDEKAMLDTSTEVLESKSSAWKLIASTLTFRESLHNSLVQEEFVGGIKQREGHDVHDIGDHSASAHHLRLDLYAYTLHMMHYCMRGNSKRGRKQICQHAL